MHTLLSLVPGDSHAVQVAYFEFSGTVTNEVYYHAANNVINVLLVVFLYQLTHPKSENIRSD